MSEKKQRFVIIDGNAIVHRAWHALPQNLMTSRGEIVNAVFGFTSILLKAIKDLRPDYIAATFDLPGPTFRHKEYSAYKATRKKKPDELYAQIPIIKEVVRAFGVPVFEKQGFEADDIIATIVEQIKNQKSPRHPAKAGGTGQAEIRNIIVTGDMDTFQLVDEQTEVFSMHKGISDTVTYDTEQVKKRFEGLTPRQLADFKALRGDPSDNIPGVKGIGEKTAIALIKEFSTLENLYKNLKSPKIKERFRLLLEEQKDNALLSKKLVTLNNHVPISFSLEECAMHPINTSAIVPLFQKLQFTSLLSRLGELAQTAQPTASKPRQTSLEISSASAGRKPRVVEEGSVAYHLVNTDDAFEAFFKKIKTQKQFALDTETTGFKPLESKLVGIGFAWKEKEAYFIPAKKAYLEKLKPILENVKTKKIGQNIKFDIKALSTENIHIAGTLFDTMIASYLINPGTRQHNLEGLVFTEFGYQMQPIEDLIGKKGSGQITMDQVPVERVSDYCCEDVDFTLRLVTPLTKQLRESNNMGLFEKLEMSLVYPLIDMETHGVKIDTEFLGQMGKDLKKNIIRLEEKIYALAGQKFNIASPLQLKEILFGVLRIPTEGIGRTKTGISSSAAELEKLKDQHPIIPLISEYRELTKLLTTYVDALPKLVSPKSGRVHTSFNQTITATGRLSSSDPNLQNIPVRTELGQTIRRAFITERGNVLVAADYSQIELRIIASLANDEKMIEGFKRGEDIHARTAAEIAGISPENVTPQMRRAAKAINFGIIYGMGPHGLAMREGISSKKAKEFIETYFTHHKSIKTYIETIIESARQMGYVETWYGRRRYFPEINSSVQPVRAAAERMATNFPIQGTAADLMKLAMIAIYEKLPRVSKRAKMIVQVHDELIAECPEDEAVSVARFLKKEMEGVYKLRAPIDVKVEMGKNWGELKPVSL